MNKEVEECASIEVHLEVALHDCVGEGCVDGGIEKFGGVMSHEVNADAGDEVEFDRAVAEFDEGAVAEARAEVWEEEAAATELSGVFECLIV